MSKLILFPIRRFSQNKRLAVKSRYDMNASSFLGCFRLEAETNPWNLNQVILAEEESDDVPSLFWIVTILPRSKR